MDSAVVLTLIALLATHVGDVAASCREVPNDDMLEYLCENGHPGDLATVPEIAEKLRISRMPLHRITADTFDKFGSNLWVLSCSHCEISVIDTDAFRKLVNLQQLSLDNNNLTVVRASWFEGLSSLTYLDVNYNDIRDIEDGVYQNLPALVDFRVSGNRLKCLNLDRMSRLHELKRMFLSENPEFACPHAVSEFLKNQRVTFEQDPEWRRLAHDTIEVHVPPARMEEGEEEEDTHHERQHHRRPPHRPEAPAVPPLTGDRLFLSSAEHNRRKKPMTTTTTSTTIRPIMLQSHVPRVEPIPPPGGSSARTSYQTPSEQQQSLRPVFYPYPQVPTQELRLPLEDARMTMGADRPALTEDTSMHLSHVPVHEMTSSYPAYVTSERSRPSSMESRLPPEDMRLMAATDRTPSTQHTLTYSVYIPTHEITSVNPSYPTPEDSRIPLVESRLLSEDTTGSTAKPKMLTEHTLTQPPYEPTREMMSYTYPYVTSERSRVPVAGSEASPEDETTKWSDGPSTEDTMIYPLYIATSDGQEKTPHGFLQVTRPRPTSDSDAPVTSRTWSTDDSMRHQPDDLSQDAELYQERPSSYQISPTGRDYTPDDKVLVDDRWSSSTNDFFIATDLPIERDEAERSKTSMTMSEPGEEDVNKEDLHYVRPVPVSHSDIMHPASTDDFYHAPYYETTVTMHPPLLDHRGHKHDDEEPVMETTTDKPLPDCPSKNSAPLARSASVLLVSIVVALFGRRVFVAGF